MYRALDLKSKDSPRCASYYHGQVISLPSSVKQWFRLCTLYDPFEFSIPWSSEWDLILAALTLDPMLLVLHHNASKTTIYAGSIPVRVWHHWIYHFKVCFIFQLKVLRILFARNLQFSTILRP